MKAVFFLDKKFPANHSFVDDFLERYFNSDEMHLIYEKQRISTGFKIEPIKENSFAVTSRRRGVGRFLNLLHVFKFLAHINSYTVILVRNCPSMLLGAKFYCFYRGERAPKLIYMSSYDHEGTATGAKRWVAFLMHYLLRGQVGGIVAVSDAGLARIQKLYAKSQSRMVIPLCANPDEFKGVKNPNLQSSKSTTFIYGGSFNRERRFEEVLEAFSGFVTREQCKLILVGVDRQLEHKWLKDYPWLAAGNVKILQRIERLSYLRLIESASFGLSLVPENSINEEMSPTKLFEYFTYGVPAIASDSVTFQAKVVDDHKAGILTKFEVESMTSAFSKALSMDDAAYSTLRKGALHAAKTYNYAAYEKKFRDMCC